MGMRVAVAGASGYGGGELLRLLLTHPAFEIGPLLAGTHAGHPVETVHPHLPALADRVFEETGAAAAASSDLVFLALPHGESARLAARLPGHVKVVDLGADFRLTDARAWARHYDTPYAGHWPYGLPELPGGRERLSAATRVAVPGCYPTAVILALAPLLRAGAIAPGDLVVVAASGVSGAGRATRPHLHGAEVMGQLSAYGFGGGHRHVPEIEQALTAAAGEPATISFTPVLAPIPRGILATCTGRLTRGTGDGEVRDALAAAYAAEPFVHVLPEGRWPGTGATLGSNTARIQVAVDRRAGRVVVVAAIDNLGKGAAGQAIQCANLMAGIDETAGLPGAGVAP